MVRKSTSVNGIVTMTVANTIKYENILVPFSSGAKQVWLTHVELDPGTPDNTANKAAYVRACVLAGKKAPANTGINQEGALTTKSHFKTTDGTDPTSYNVDGPSDLNGAFPIQKEQNGDYYFTVAMVSGACTAVADCGYRADFLMEF
jgi:hypothetical protein